MSRAIFPLCLLLGASLCLCACAAPAALPTEPPAQTSPSPTPRPTRAPSPSPPETPREASLGGVRQDGYCVYEWRGRDYRYVWLDGCGEPVDFAPMLPMLCAVASYRLRYDSLYPNLRAFDPAVGWYANMNQHSLENPVYAWGFLSVALGAWGDLHPDAAEGGPGAQYARVVPFGAARDILAACFPDYAPEYELPAAPPEGVAARDVLGGLMEATKDGYAFTADALREAEGVAREPWPLPCIVQDCGKTETGFEVILWFVTDTLYYNDPLICSVRLAPCDAAENPLGFPCRIERFVRYDGVDIYRYGP